MKYTMGTMTNSKKKQVFIKELESGKDAGFQLGQSQKLLCGIV